MDAEAPKVVVPVFCAAKKAPCPHCGKKGKLQRVLQREVRTLAYQQIVVLEITYGAYAARCDCCKTFRTNAGHALAQRGPPMVRVPCAAGHQRSRAGRGASAAGKTQPSRQERPTTQTWPTEPGETKACPAERGPTAKDKTHFVCKRRHLIVTREENLSDWQRKDLQTMLEYLPELRTLRKFVKASHRLFETDQSEHQAWRRRSALLRCQEFPSVPELAQVMAMLSEPAFRKMIAFLRGPANRRVMVRTNNHVERCNRKLRFLEKVRYKWRRPRTLVRFMVLAMAHVWKATLPKVTPSKRKRRQRQKPCPQAA